MGSEMCIRDRSRIVPTAVFVVFPSTNPTPILEVIFDRIRSKASVASIALSLTIGITMSTDEVFSSKVIVPVWAV